MNAIAFRPALGWACLTLVGFGALSSLSSNHALAAESGSSTLTITGDESFSYAPESGSRTRLVITSFGEAPAPATPRSIAAPAVPDAHVAPASWLEDGPPRPPMSAGIQSVQPRRAAAVGASTSQKTQKKKNSRKTAAPTAARAAAIKKPAPLPYEPSPEEERLAAQELPTAEHLLLQAHLFSKQAKTQADYAHVVRLCAESMRQGPDEESRKFALQLSAWALNRRGRMRADEEQVDLALADFTAAANFDETCWRAYHNRSVTNAQQGRFADAFDDVCRVIALNPRFAKAYSNRAALYAQANDARKAIADYDRALRIDPKLLPALVGRGRLCHAQHSLDEALENLTAAVQQPAATADVYCSRADLLADMGRYSNAMQDYAQAIELDPRCEHAYRNGAWLLATCPDDSVRDIDAAVVGAKKALECGYGPRHAALDTLAAALANAGRFEEAIGALQQALDVAPEEAQASYQARLNLYESRQPFRTQPIDAAVERAAFVDE